MMLLWLPGACHRGAALGYECFHCDRLPGLLLLAWERFALMLVGGKTIDRVRLWWCNLSAYLGASIS